MSKTIFTVLAFAFLSIMFTGCATLLAPKTHPLALNSSPGGAEVIVNGVKMGETPVKLDLKADKSYTIEFKKEGYEPVTRIVNTKTEAGWIILDAICGLVPVIVDASTGAWNKLDQSNVNAVLNQQNN